MFLSKSHNNGFTPPSSASNQSPNNSSWLVRFGWLAPVLVAFVVYSVSLNNYFAFDDFLWLNRARTFNNGWLQIFRPDVVYFDPLVHLLFRLNYLIGALDPRWYHGIDLAIHAANSFLVYHFARLLSGDEKSALYGSILFASSFAIVDAVVWPSSRVDLLSTFFSLGVLIQFLRYLRSGFKRNLCFATMLFIMALAAKGTPLVLPLVLFWLGVQEKKQLRHMFNLAPFVAVALLYLILLKMTMHRATLPPELWHFNLGNLALSFSSLFVPEEILSQLNLTFTTCALLAVVSAAVIAGTWECKSIAIRRIGCCMLLVAVLPVLILTDLKLATKSADLYQLLLSPSHRTYLASVGAALLCGGVLRFVEISLQRVSSRLALATIVIVITGVVIGSTCVIKERNDLWKTSGKRFETAFNSLSSFRGTVAEGAQIGLVNFPGSHGFVTPMASICLGVNRFTIADVTIGMIGDRDVLEKAEKSYLFILGGDGHVYDKTELYRQQLLYNRLDLFYSDQQEFRHKGEEIAKRLGTEIERLSQTKKK